MAVDEEGDSGGGARAVVSPHLPVLPCLCTQA